MNILIEITRRQTASGLCRHCAWTLRGLENKEKRKTHVVFFFLPFFRFSRCCWSELCRNCVATVSELLRGCCCAELCRNCARRQDARRQTASGTLRGLENKEKRKNTLCFFFCLFSVFLDAVGPKRPTPSSCCFFESRYSSRKSLRKAYDFYKTNNFSFIQKGFKKTKPTQLRTRRKKKKEKEKKRKRKKRKKRKKKKEKKNKKPKTGRSDGWSENGWSENGWKTQFVGKWLVGRWVGEWFFGVEF